MFHYRIRLIKHARVVCLMALLPWLPWIIDDWLTSETRMAMSPTERSIYQDLLAFQWRDGHLSSDHQILAALAAVSPEVFEVAAPAVLKHFNLRRGRLRNKKLAILRESALDKCTKMARRGQKGGEAKASKVKEICASSTPQADTRARAHSDSVSSSGFPGLDSKPTNQEKTSSRAREISAGANDYRPDAGWAWISSSGVYPQIRDMDAACRAWNSVVEDQATEDAIRAALAPGGPWRASAQWERGVYDDLANWLFRKLWQGRPARYVSEGERERERMRAL